MKPPFEGDTFLEEWMLRELYTWRITKVVETGTETGATAAWFANHSSSVFTCDVKALLDRTLPGNVTFRECSSVELLNDVCTQLIGHRVLFWLDAHCVSEDSCALPDELQILSRHPGEEWLVAIHDFEVPGHPELGFDVYPTFGPLNMINVEPLVKPLYPKGYAISFNTRAIGACRGVALFSPI